MAPRPPNEEELRNRFNQLSGTRSGRPSRPSKAASETGISQRRKKANQGAGRSSTSTWVSHGGGKVPASVRKSREAWFGSGSANPYTSSNKVFQNIYDNLTRELNQQSRDQISVRTAYAAQMLDQQVDPETGVPLQDVEHQRIKNEAIAEGADPELAEVMAASVTQPSIDEQYLGGNLQKYVVEPLSRPGSAIAGGIHAAMEGEYAAEDEGKGNWGQITEALSRAPSGFKKGITGEEKHGWGDIYELGKNEGDDVISGALRSLEESHPSIEQTISRGFGLTGDIAADPLGRLIGGAKTGVINGRRATAASTRQYVREIAERWAAETESNIITSATKSAAGNRVFPSEAAIADNFESQMLDVIEAAENRISGGASRGRYELHTPKMTAETAGIHGGQAIQDSLTMHLSDRVQKVVDGISGRGPKLDGNALDAYAKTNPDFSDFLDDLADDLANDGKIPLNPSKDQLANYLSKGDETLIRRIEQGVIDKKYSPYIQDVTDQITREFKNTYYNAPGIRVGKKVIPVKPVGKAFSTLQNKYMGNAAKNFRYNATFPGTIGLDTTRARAHTVVGMENFEKLLREKALPFTKKEAEDIHLALENNTALPANLQAAADWIRAEYKKMYDDELVAGARGRHRDGKAVDPYDPNYVHVANRGDSVDARTDFKWKRKSTIHDNLRKGNNEGAGRFKTVNAKDKGLKPVENAFEALRQRRIKHNRDMVRAKLRQDMLEKYGITSHISKSGKNYAADARNMELAKFENLPEHLRQLIQDTGEEMYLPRQMSQMLDEFDRISKWNGTSQGQFVRKLTKTMNILKRVMTLPWPGFHNKNMIGDVFMSLLDDVNPDDYVNVARKYAQDKAGRTAEWQIVPGRRMTFRQMWNKYQNEANSGFVTSELGDFGTATKAMHNIPKRVGQKVEKKIQDISGYREDAGRFTHYVTSYRQEAEALWKQGIRDWDEIDRIASSAALWRVNNYKFDYNALSLWEKKTKTLAFPFYTFIRKAAPTLVQALYQDPRWINQWTRFLYNNSVHGEEGASGFDGFRVPEDIGDSRSLFMPGEEEKEEPW